MFAAMADGTITVERHRTELVRMAPTAAQEQQFARFAGASRFVYNLCLDQRVMHYQLFRRSPLYTAQARELPELKAAVPWLKDVHADVLQQAMRDLDKAFQAFYRRERGFPDRRAKGLNDSFRFPYRRVKNTSRARGGGDYESLRIRRISRRWGEINLPKIGWVRFRWTRMPRGKVFSATVKRDALGWRLSIDAKEAVPAPEPSARPAVGIDRGVRATVATSDGRLISMAPEFRTEQERSRFVRICRALRRSQPGSRRQKKLLGQFRLMHRRRARRRDDFTHKLSRELASAHGLIVLEDLSVDQITAQRRPGVTPASRAAWNRIVLGQGWGRLADRLSYKAEEEGSAVIKVPPYNTSRTCSACGQFGPGGRNGPLGDTFACPACGHQEDADINAAKVILRRGKSEVQSA